MHSVVIARDADPAGSPADQALWCGVVRRLRQDIKVAVTARPNDIAPKEAPPLKDLDDVWRYDPELVSVLLKGANLEHGRLGEAVDNAILEEALRLNPVALGRARRGIAGLLRISVVALDDELALRVRKRAETKTESEEGLPGQALVYPPLEPWPDPVNGAELLTEISTALPHYVRLTKSQCDTVALGLVHGHVFDFFDTMPIFTITSPQKRSGKTRLMRTRGARFSQGAFYQWRQCGLPDARDRSRSPQRVCR